MKRRRRKSRQNRHRLRRTLISIAAGALGIAGTIYFLQKIVPYPATADSSLDLQTVYEMSLERLKNRSSKSLRRIPVFAHRGFEENALENSFASFDAALLAGCPQIELDVRASKDGVLYVVHDRDLKSIAGEKGVISEMSSEELDQIIMKNGEKVHTLAEVVDRYKNQLIYLVEFKEDLQDITPFTDVVDAYPQYAANLQVQSFYPEVLKMVHKRFPNMFVQLLVNDYRKVDEAIAADWLDSIALDQAILSKDRIEKIHEAGKECWIWTVDDPKNIDRFLEWGADGVITNYSSAVEIAKKFR